MSDMEHNTVKVLGVTMDTRFTVANFIQIGLIVFALINGGYWLYFGLRGQFEAVNSAQTEIVRQQEQIKADVSRIQADRATRSVVVQGDINDLDDRLSKQETNNALAAASIAVTSSRLIELVTKVDNLDDFLRQTLAEYRKRVDDNK